MGCITSCFKSTWYYITDRFYKIETVDRSELLQLDSFTPCSYPFCYNITSISINNNTEYIKFRNKIYCSRNCLNSHKNMNFGDANYESAQYADL